MRGLLAALLLLLLVFPGQASAHAALVRSFPAQGQSLDHAPPELEVEFNEPVAAEFTPLVVRNTRGERVDQGDAALDPRSRNRATVSLKPLPEGLYTAVYRVASLDGHPIEGTIAFAVGTVVEATETPAPPKTPPAVSIAHGVALLLACLLAGLPLATGGAVRKRWGLALLGALAVTGLVELSLYAVRASGEPWSVPLLAKVLTQTRVGFLWVARLGLVWVTTRKPKSLTIPAAAAVLLTFSLQSHAMATGNALPVITDWLHLLALAPWAGGLLGFALDPRPDLVPRFSKIAAASVLVLILTGIYSASLHLPSAAALTATGYGRALLAKLALLAPVLALAAYHLIKKGHGPFRLTVRGELALMTGIFVAAGFLSTMPPAGVEIALKQGPFSETATADGYPVTLTITPARLGFNQAVTNMEAGANVDLRLTMLSHDMGTQSVDAVETAPGTYLARDVILGMPGEWRVEVVALTKGGREIRTAFQVTIPSPP
ncbi:MAG TPA: copper resistance protein CopC [Symbiobacteriaceae bacterium]|nr:copper resistance protein CopC [Symbiobacteriaceae bacterium]